MQATEDRLKTALYLDDQRTPTKTIPGYQPWIVVRNAREFADYLQNNPLPNLISFDHDLGEEHYTDYAEQVSKMGWQSPSYELYKEKTGLDCAKYLCVYFQDVLLHLDAEQIETVSFPICSVHSHNPVGAQNIQSYINGFLRHMGWEENCYIGKHAFTLVENQ